jgi:hypothetical protein
VSLSFSCATSVAGATADGDDVELTEFSDEMKIGYQKNLQKLDTAKVF